DRGRHGVERLVFATATPAYVRGATSTVADFHCPMLSTRSWPGRAQFLTNPRHANPGPGVLYAVAAGEEGALLSSGSRRRGPLGHSYCLARMRSVLMERVSTRGLDTTQCNGGKSE